MYESAPDWLSESISTNEHSNVTKIDISTETAGDAAEVSAVESASRSTIDQIISDMALDKPEVVKARISSGNMNFEDFVATTTAMTQADSSALSVPTGYEKLIQAMTLEERRNPQFFRESEGGADERVSRIASDAGVDAGVASTFLKDFGSLQRFFARMQSGAKEGALKQSMDMAAEYLANKPRRMRRKKESQNALLKKAGQELRDKKALRLSLTLFLFFYSYFSFENLL